MFLKKSKWTIKRQLAVDRLVLITYEVGGGVNVLMIPPSLYTLFATTDSLPVFPENRVKNHSNPLSSVPLENHANNHSHPPPLVSLKNHVKNRSPPPLFPLKTTSKITHTPPPFPLRTKSKITHPPSLRQIMNGIQRLCI